MFARTNRSKRLAPFRCRKPSSSPPPATAGRRLPVAITLLRRLIIRTAVKIQSFPFSGAGKWHAPPPPQVMETASGAADALVGDAPDAENCVLEKPRKRARVDGGADVRRVAEIAMVLAAASRVRGGRAPSAGERELMAEAREKLVEICGLLAPKDLLGRDAVRVVLEDLGLSKLKDQRLGFRPAKVSIAEKLALTQRKMEESGREVTIQAPPGPSQVFPLGLVTAIDGHAATFHPGETHSNTQPQQAVIIMSQPPPVSSFSSDPHSFALPGKEPTQFILDPRVNGTPYLLQVQANPTVINVELKSEISSSQVSTSAVPKMGETYKPIDQFPSLSEGVQEPSSLPMAPQPNTDHNTNALGIQTRSGQSLSSSHSVQSLYVNHLEIARSVQKVLQSRVPDPPKWILPSTDYMSKPLTCPVCKLIISDIKTVLVCDSCEKGTHLKCLQTFNQKSIPQGEWHCPKCLILSNGRPLPPKYGRVSRSTGAAKASISSDDKKMEHSDQSDNSLQKTVALGDSTTLNSAAATSKVQSPDDLISDVPSSGNVQVLCPKEMTTDNDHPKDVSREYNISVADVVSAVAVDDSQGKLLSDSNQLSCDSKIITSPAMLDSKGQTGDLSFGSSETGVSHDSKSQLSCNLQEVCEIKMNDAMVAQELSFGGMLEKEDPQESKALTGTGKCNESEPKCEAEGASHDCDPVVSEVKLDNSDGTNDISRSSVEVLLEVAWIGEALKVVDEKTYYESCSIDGIIYKTQDYALVGSNSCGLYPSKVQVLWEDNKTRTKWAELARCYFPNEMPLSIHLPSNPEKDEVYQSNHESTVLLGLLRGPCKVFSHNEYHGECKRRQQDPSCILPPIYVCRWFYDESKNVFTPIVDQS